MKYGKIHCSRGLGGDEKYLGTHVLGYVVYTEPLKDGTSYIQSTVVKTKMKINE